MKKRGIVRTVVSRAEITSVALMTFKDLDSCISDSRISTLLLDEKVDL